MVASYIGSLSAGVGMNNWGFRGPKEHVIARGCKQPAADMAKKIFPWLEDAVAQAEKTPATREIAEVLERMRVVLLQDAAFSSHPIYQQHPIFQSAECQAWVAELRTAAALHQQAQDELVSYNNNKLAMERGKHMEAMLKALVERSRLPMDKLGGASDLPPVQPPAPVTTTVMAVANNATGSTAAPTPCMPLPDASNSESVFRTGRERGCETDKYFVSEEVREIADIWREFRIEGPNKKLPIIANMAKYGMEQWYLASDTPKGASNRKNVWGKRNKPIIFEVLAMLDVKRGLELDADGAVQRLEADRNRLGLTIPQYAKHLRNQGVWSRKEDRDKMSSMLDFLVRALHGTPRTKQNALREQVAQPSPQAPRVLAFNSASSSAAAPLRTVLTVSAGRKRGTGVMGDLIVDLFRSTGSGRPKTQLPKCIQVTHKQVGGEWQLVDPDQHGTNNMVTPREFELLAGLSGGDWRGNLFDEESGRTLRDLKPPELQ